jgi:hypothetical protein
MNVKTRNRNGRGFFVILIGSVAANGLAQAVFFISRR